MNVEGIGYGLFGFGFEDVECRFICMGGCGL